jgi:DnaD/phage-associated family protein
MNYMAEIKAFYDLVQVKQLSTGQIALWHALMHINNKCAWAKWFTVSNLTLELYTGLSRKGIYNARNTLKQYGMIDFKSNGTKATSYRMISLLKITQVTTQTTTQDATQNTTQDSATLNKQDKTRQIVDVVDNPQTPLQATVKLFQKAGMGEINQAIGDVLADMADTYPMELIEEAFRRAKINHATSIRYVEKILIAWDRKDIKSLAQLETYEKNGRRGSGSSKGNNGESSAETDPYTGIGITL